MNVNKVLTTNYEKTDTWWTGTKRTQTNPNEPKSPKAKNERKLNCDKGLPKYLPLWSPEKRTQTNPIKLSLAQLALSAVERVEWIP